MRIWHRFGLALTTIALAFAPLLTVVDCASLVRQQQQTQKSNTVADALDSSSQATQDFVAWDKAHQEAIVSSSKTRQEAEQRLADYREARAKLIDLVKRGAKITDAALTRITDVKPTNGGPP